MAFVLMYFTAGMFTTVVAALIVSVVGDELGPWQLFWSFVAWPVTLIILFVYALEGSR